ncbi:MAG: TonB-dependent receptor [Acidobacteria bacterium]|nr:TonB-dependent receptor [Acidobacteriota bacterium]
MNLTVAPKSSLKMAFFAVAVIAAFFVLVSDSRANTSGTKRGGLGIIKGFVKDQTGNPIAEAYVMISNAETSRLVKQVRSATNGSFLAKVLPGTYKLLAVAQGFNPISLSEVEVNRSGEFVYKFSLERAGSGNTLPEKRGDRNSSRWSIRASAIRNSVYQNTEGETPIDGDDVVDAEPADVQSRSERKSQTVIETFAATRDGAAFGGANFATLLPLTENSELVIAGQTTTGATSPQRLEARYTFRPNDSHQIRINTSVAKLGSVELGDQQKQIGQFSVQATDEWRVKNGFVLVLGFDYSKFIGAGDDFSVSPRLGLQYDINSRTRFRSAYTTQNEDRTWSRAIELEDSTVMFREPVAVSDFVVENNRPRMNRSSRFEFGVERILDSNSTIEANVFFDLTNSRGVGLMNIPFEFTGGEVNDFVANQQGRAQGARVVYSRRLNGLFSTSAGYSFGNGQKLSEKAITTPASAFEDALFQTFFGQFDAALKTGTQVKTVFRLSSQATVFAIDPFQGRMMIYDPGLSVLVTQSLPTLGLPIRAQAVIDARNLFDFQTGINGEEGSLKLSSQKRALSGGIMVRF